MGQTITIAINFWEEVIKPLLEKITNGIKDEISGLENFENCDKIIAIFLFIILIIISRILFPKIIKKLKTRLK